MMKDKFIEKYLDREKKTRIRYSKVSLTSDWKEGRTGDCGKSVEFEETMMTKNRFSIERETTTESSMKANFLKLEAALKSTISEKIGMELEKEHTFKVSHKVDGIPCYKTIIFWQENMVKYSGVVEKKKKKYFDLFGKEEWVYEDSFEALESTGINTSDIQIFDPTCDGCENSDIAKNPKLLIKTNNRNLTPEERNQLTMKMSGTKDIARQLFSFLNFYKR